jgi:hypothetical protein
LDRVLAAHRHLQKNAGSQCCKILQSISWVEIIDRGFGLFISSGIPLELVRQHFRYGRILFKNH